MPEKTKNIATVRVKTDLVKPIDVDIMAEDIKSVAANITKALKGGLTMRALCVLIQDQMPNKAKIPLHEIESVLKYAGSINTYLTK